jgi:hypothetical protein
MSDIDYPLSLPGVLIAPFSISESEHFRADSYTTGPVENQLLASLTHSDLSASWSFNAVEYQAFDAWFKYIVNFGATPFNMLLPVNNALVNYECQFSSKVRKTRNGKRNHVSASIMANKVTV